MGGKMEFGFFIRGQYRQGDDMVVRFGELMEQARIADRLGFRDLLSGMHYAGYPLSQFQLLPFLSRVMVEAPNMRLIPGIILLSLHKPLDIAEQLATIDVMSNGRLVFGCGLGYREVEFRGFGTTQQERVPRLVENLEAIKRLWTEEHVNQKGSHFELVDCTLSLKPVQKPMPPIWIGANADAAVRRAAHLADTWFINPHQRMETIARQLEVYKRALDEAGKPFPAELPLMREIFVAKTREEAERIARPHLEEKYRVYHEWGQDKAMPKDDADLSLDFDELTRDRFLFGSPDEVAEQIIGYHRNLGVNRMIVALHWVGMPNSQVVDGMHLFAEEVMPKVREAI
jgi:alkanesulfonate monooxygenase SsuD/methylene tetrahydromethanopterin reductase-like flavin-dependent oxidoreductase (luciferase family)